jgi:Subtilase family
MGVMGGSIENGQDPSYPGSHTTPQVDRSGIAGGAALYYYHASANTAAGAAIALQAAVNEGIDIVNNSWGVVAPNWTPSDPTTDISGLN